MQREKNKRVVGNPILYLPHTHTILLNAMAMMMLEMGGTWLGRQQSCRAVELSLLFSCPVLGVGDIARDQPRKQAEVT